MAVDAAIDAAHKCVLEDVRESCTRRRVTIIHYNFVRGHMKLRISLAMAARIDNHLWSIKDIVKLMG